MAVDVGAAAGRSSAALETVAGRVLALPARWLLAGIVTISFLVRAAIGLTHATPEYMPDEYIYSSLARSLALHGKPLIRGHLVHFPSLLEPILAAPFWLTGDHTFAYRATLLENALAMSLAAIPVYLLASHLQLGRNYALGAAAFTVTVQSLFFTTFVLADPVAYPLALTALYFGVKALEQPSRRNQVWFVVLCALAAFARIQYLALPAAYVAAALIQSRARPRDLRRYALSLALLIVPGLVLLAAGRHRLFGYYESGSQVHLRPLGALHWAATDLFLLAFATGIVLVPAALACLVLQVVRPASERAGAFATLAFTTTLALLAEAGIYASSGTDRFQERYLIALFPLVPILYALHQQRSRDERVGKVVTTLTALTLLLLATRIPLSGFTIADNKQDSPLLIGLFRLEQLIGIANGSLLISLVATGFALVAIGIALKPRFAPAAIPLALVFVAALSFAAWNFDARKADRARARLAADVSWVDDAKLGDVVMLETAGDPRWAPSQELFWNRSVDSLYLLGGGEPIDLFASPGVRVLGDGTMLVQGKVVRRPLLVATYGTTTDFRGATLVERAANYSLWRPAGTPRLAQIIEGLYADKWLAAFGHLTVWPDATGKVGGTMRLVLWAPAGTWASPLHLTAPGVNQHVTIKPGERCVVTVPVAAHGPWTLVFESAHPIATPDGRIISVQAAEPRLSPAGEATGTRCETGVAPTSPIA